MSMNERVAGLRRESLATVPFVTAERAQLVTRAYQQYHGRVSTPVLRALCFQYLLENKTICINVDELIVGERGPLPKATPTFPELCCHSIEDLDVLRGREKISFGVSPETRRVFEQEVIPYWQGLSLREKLFGAMAGEWLAAYRAGVFTEFMEQRAPGHTVADDKIYRKGFLDIKEDIQKAAVALDFLADPLAYDKREELRAMEICADAIMALAGRYADLAWAMAQGAADPARKRELAKIAAVCSRVPAHAPENFWEALQAYWFVHLGVILELNTWDSFNPGRLDQHLYPFYHKEMAAGTLTPDEARELLQCFWIKFNNQPAPPKVGVTLAESSTYTDFANINNGGLTVDGQDAVNDVTYLVLDVIDEMRLLQPSSNIQLSKKNPDRFLRRACQIIRKGWGQPSIFNADLVVAELIRQGKSAADARQGGTSGCVEAGAFGKESYILTGYFNLVKVLEATLHNGMDLRTGKQIGPATGEAAGFGSYEELFQAFCRQLGHFVAIKVRGNNIIERLYAEYMPAPFLSTIVDDCIASGRDYNAGGARYDTTYIQMVGLGSVADSLTALKYHVYEHRTFSMQELLQTIDKDYADAEPLRQTLLNKTPRYGNDDAFADAVMQSVCTALYRTVNGRKNTRGGTYGVNYLSTTCHTYFGSVCGATPDGRKAGQPLSEGISPVQGADRFGPTAVIKSAAQMDHLLTGGTLLNLKFTPRILADDEGLTKLAHLIRSYFKLDGHHIQFNVVSAATLREAQREPEKHRDLIVRVAGYSDYFCDLTGPLQEEIIARTEHSDL